jgi:hypothetical protein
VRKATLLTKANCALCEQAKVVLQRLAEEGSLSVELVDVNSPEGAGRAAASGMPFPPGMLLDGEPFGYGRLSERKLRRELAKRPEPLR